MKDNYTEIWQKYEKCKEYLDGKGIVAKTERNWNFFIGDQWKGLKTGGQELPMLNFIKPIVQYKVSTVAQNAMTAVYSDIASDPSLQPIYDKLNLYWQQCWEKAKMTQTAWKVLKAAAIQGDSYVYWENGDTLQPPMILDNSCVFLSNENIDNIQKQEYIIVRERWTLDAVKEHAKKNGISNEEIKKIQTDNDTQHQIFNKKEVEDKVTVLFYMEKRDGVVHTGRATKDVIIEKVAEIKPTQAGKSLKGLSVYPIIPYVWENVPNSARGVGEVEQLIPNQLELNKTLARRSMAVNIGAYPRLAYDANAIVNPEDLNKVGVAIAVNGGAQSIHQMVDYLNATNISSDADKLSADLLQITKDLAGASDYALGNVNPEQASGTAIIAVRDSAQVPLSEQVARSRQWTEDVSLLWFDLWIAYSGDGIKFITEDENGQPVEVMIPREELEGLKPTVKIDVSPDNQWTKLAEQQTLDNLFVNGQLTLEEYVECTPDNSSVPKAKLQNVIDKRKASMQSAETQDIDPQIVYQELIRNGMPEEEALAAIQTL
jgi:hypothetical protein